MSNISYIKENEPKAYQFFIEYWSFVKKYWVIDNTEDWWNCFCADLAYYVSKYENNDFYVSLIMQVYIRNKDELVVTSTVKELTAFLKEWWEYINKYYADHSEKEWWANFVEDTKGLLNKYNSNSYYTGLVDAFFEFKAES